MKLCYFITLLFATSCAQMPSLFQTIDDVATDTAIKVEIDKEAINQQTDVFVQVNVENKDKSEAK